MRTLIIAAMLAGLATSVQAQSPVPTPDAQKQPPSADPAPEKSSPTGPFGGNLTGAFTVLSDYSYRGISQTQRHFAFQPTIGYETPTLGPLPITAYIGAWGSNVVFPNTGATVEIDLLAGLRAKAFNDKLTFDLGFTGYRYPGADLDVPLFYNFDEYALLAGYDFGVAAVSAAVRYSPNFFANSGIAWYKWAQLTVPLPFIKLHDDVSLKVFGTVGSQYVERNLLYGIPRNDYWDWQVGLTVNVRGFDLTVAYTDTNIERGDCGSTGNCEARAIFSIGKTF